MTINKNIKFGVNIPTEGNSFTMDMEGTCADPEKAHKIVKGLLAFKRHASGFVIEESGSYRYTSNEISENSHFLFSE
jgi:lipid II:glycine glycyltransferase (peptidoglycan interpeptide bridge formation enzyme)